MESLGLARLLRGVGFFLLHIDLVLDGTNLQCKSQNLINIKESAHACTMIQFYSIMDTKKRK